MIEITFVNDGTGTDESSNYRYQVAIRHIIIAQGRVEGHNRADDWRALVREMVAPGLLRAGKAISAHLKAWGMDIELDETGALVTQLDAAIAKAEGDNANSTTET